MQPPRDLLEAVLQTAGHRGNAELQPLAQQAPEAHHPRPAVEGDHVQVDAVVALQIRRREQMVHHLDEIDAVGARHDDQASRILVIGFVAQILHHGQLLVAHLVGDLLLHAVSRHLVREGRDDDVAVLDLVGGARLEAADTLLVELLQVRARRDDLGACREVRPLHVLHQLGGRSLRVFEQMNARRGHFPQVVRRNVRRHAHGDARCPVQQQVGQSRRQQRRLLHRAIEVRRPIHCAVRQLPQQDVRILRELGLGVAHRREGLRIVLRAPIALAVDNGKAVRERLRHQHHRLVAGAVAVRMELADDVADRARRFLVLVDGGEAELAHRVDDAALHRLQAVRQRGQGPVENDVHRVVEVGFLGEGAQRLLLHPFEIQFLLLHGR